MANLPSILLKTVSLRKERKICVLPDEFQQVGTAGLDKSGAQMHIMVNIVHADGQTAQRKLRRIGLQIHSCRVSRREHGCALNHSSPQMLHFQSNKGEKREQGSGAYPLTARRIHAKDQRLIA